MQNLINVNNSQSNWIIICFDWICFLVFGDWFESWIQIKFRTFYLLIDKIKFFLLVQVFIFCPRNCFDVDYFSQLNVKCAFSSISVHCSERTS